MKINYRLSSLFLYMLSINSISYNAAIQDNKEIMQMVVVHKDEDHVWQNHLLDTIKDKIMLQIHKLSGRKDLDITQHIDGNMVTFSVTEPEVTKTAQNAFNSVYAALANTGNAFVGKIQKVLTALTHAPHDFYVYFNGPTIINEIEDAIPQSVAQEMHELHTIVQEEIL